MLQNLHVKNLALIDEAEVDFSGGLNILTGETGAGKSIILGSVSLALGGRYSADMLRKGADKGLVELTFYVENPETVRKLEEMDLSPDGGQIIITRRFNGNRSVSRINGETVTLGRLKEAAQVLIDIHGQHEHQSLLYEKNHLTILDEFAHDALGNRLTRCRELHRSYQKCRRKWQDAQADESQRAKELDFLQFELEEIEAANLKPGEDEELEGSYRLMANGQKIMEALSETGTLTGANGCAGAEDEIGHAVRALAAVQSYDDGLEELGTSLGEIEALLNDFNRSLSGYMDEFTFDAQAMKETEERLDLLNRLKTKYGNTLEEILEFAEEKRQRMDVLMNYETYIEGLQREYEQKKKEFLRLTDEISQIRKDYAKKLSDQIVAALVDLNFLDVRFEIAFKKLAEPNENGGDEVCFMISTNPGLPLRPLASVASGGELSRIMLAIKAVMADKDAVETLIFDEIDTGISGRTAQKVSEKMAVIAKNHQLLCITHLAQIAAMADQHYIIEKKPANSKTVTNIGLLSEEESVQELARILGGARITDTVLESAREMKELAESMKKMGTGLK